MMHLEASASAALEAWDVHKRYGRRVVLRGVDLRLCAGRTLAIVGSNGAGKTTLLRILSTLARPSRGVVRVGGIDAAAAPLAARRRLGVMFGTTFLYDELTGRENLRYYASLYNLPPGDATRHIDQLAVLIGVATRLDERVATYSRGMTQRLSLARALLHRPDVLLLDEPDAGLDPAATADLPHLLRGDGASERAILLATHDLQLAIDVADDVAVLADGRFVFAAPTRCLTPEALRHAYNETNRPQP